jgi:quercetin dioxygenase-like cupin family protein
MMRVGKASAQNYITVFDGIERKTLTYGKNTILTEFRMLKDKRLPKHDHPEEQTGYLVTGHITLFIEEKYYDIKPGDSWTIPENTEHGAETLEDSVAIEVFSPVRVDYLPDDRRD